MRDTIHGLPNHVDNREMYEDPGMVSYMSNRISAMEHEYPDCKIADISVLSKSQISNINQELGLEESKLVDNLKRLWKFLKDNIIKFINFVCGFVLKFFKRSTDFVTFHKNTITALTNLDKEFTSLEIAMKADGKTPMHKQMSVKDISDKVKYMSYVLGAVGVFIKTTIAEDYEVKRAAVDTKFTTPFYFMYAINALPLILNKLPDSSTDNVDFEGINASFKKIQNEILESFETFIERFDGKGDESKSKSLGAIYLVRSNIEKIKEADIELSSYETEKYNQTLREHVEKINFDASITKVIDYGKEFKKLDKVRKETIELVKSMETVEDFSRYVMVCGLDFNDSLAKKLNKLLLDSSSVLTALNVLVTTTIETYVTDITEYISTAKSYIASVKEDKYTPEWRKRINEKELEKNQK